MSLTDEQKKLLSQPLDPKHVVKPTGQFGAKGDYIEGWHAIAEANRIFGHDGWSYTIHLIQDSLVQGTDSKNNPQWQAAYTCLCTVTAGGVTRQDVGFGSGFAKQVGDAIEGATKEAATDALKRALRTFGHPFGLALYDKSRAHVQAPQKDAPDPNNPITDEQRTWLQSQCEKHGATAQEVCEHFNVTSFKQLVFGQLSEAKAWLESRKKAA